MKRGKGALDTHRISSEEKKYVCIDLKSFYASVECVERGLNPLTTKLVVADPDRTEKTVCLAITPAMKALGIKNRCRVFEIPEGVDYIMATPRMGLYLEYSANIYSIYLRYISKEDIHVYSVDEVFLDVTDYLHMYNMTARELGIRIMKDIENETGITATCGIGTNLYLAKIALDITAKKVDDHIGELDEESYRRTLWNHLPLTDFWRIGKGTVKRLAQYGIYTMGQIAEADEDMLYGIFGVDAELLIDHAWGVEPTTIADIKNYRTYSSSLSNGQVLSRDYQHEEGRLVTKEMADILCLELVDKGLVAQSITLELSYSRAYTEEHAHGTAKLGGPSSSARLILPVVEQLYDRIKDERIPIRKISLSFNQVMDEAYIQYDLFTDPEELERERKMQRAMNSIKNRFGKNAILKGMNLSEGATAMERNRQIGGHRSGTE